MWVAEVELDHPDQILEFPDYVDGKSIQEVGRDGLKRRLSSNQPFSLRKIMADDTKGPWIEAVEV